MAKTYKPKTKLVLDPKVAVKLKNSLVVHATGTRQ